MVAALQLVLPSDGKSRVLMLVLSPQGESQFYKPVKLQRHNDRGVSEVRTILKLH